MASLATFPGWWICSVYSWKWEEDSGAGMTGHLTISEDIQVPVTGFGKSGHLDETSMIYSASLLEPSLLVSRHAREAIPSWLQNMAHSRPHKKIIMGWLCKSMLYVGGAEKVGISHCDTLGQFSVVTKWTWTDMDRAQSSQLSACWQWLQERSSRME